MDKKVAALIVALVLSVTATTISVIALTQQPATVLTSNGLASLRSGIYTDGELNTPNYFVSLEVSPDGAISGAIDFIYQDGQTAVALTFLGSGQDNIANVNVIYSTPANVDPARPAAISFTWGANEIRLGECGSYLAQQGQFAPTCNFHYSPKGLR